MNSYKDVLEAFKARQKPKNRVYCFRDLTGKDRERDERRKNLNTNYTNLLRDYRLQYHS